MNLAERFNSYHRTLHGVILWLALVIEGGLTAIWVRTWEGYLFAVLLYGVTTGVWTNFFSAALDAWWHKYGNPGDGGGDYDASPDPSPSWPYVVVPTKHRTDLHV